MCGIAGIISPGHAVDPERVRRMTQTMVHRGPDDDGLHVSPCGAMGMRRLSIIDLESGKQPICNEDGTLWIVFNGEIYNYRTLSRELEASGHRFRTRSDTEVIVHAYEEDGPACVHRFNGMFSFAIHDVRRDSVFIARDRLGIKPLYYHWDGRTLIFASEIKAILESGLVQAEVDSQSVWHYLSFRYVPAPLTIWKGIRKLPPGHTLSLCGTGAEPVIERYWDINFSSGEGTYSARHLEEFSELFLDSVRHRLIADVPVGIFLSGGLDSSAVAAAVAEVHNAPLSTFSVAFSRGGEFSELQYAREVAGVFGTDHHEVVIDEHDFMQLLPQLVWLTDEPMADPASIPLYCVSRLAAEQVKVVLSGEGADEILAGYTFEQPMAQWARLDRFHRIPRMLRSTLPEGIMRAAGMTRTAQRLATRNLPLAERNNHVLPHMTHYFDTPEKLRLFGAAALPVPDSLELVRAYYARSGTRDPLHQMLYVYCQDWLVEDLLMKADRMTMGASLELRVPFLDYRLVEWLAAAPVACKVGRDRVGRLDTKHVLRDFAQTRLPRSILERPKQGFPVPVQQWMRPDGPLGKLVRERLGDPDAKLRSWFVPKVLDETIAIGLGGSRSAAQKLWILLILELWAQQWN